MVEQPKPGIEDVLQEDVTIVTCDHHHIKGTLFQRSGDSIPQIAVVFNNGAGVGARYYHRFAKYLASEGVATFTYDYRGIGRSRLGKLRGFQASFEDWVEYDCTAAIDFVRSRFDVPTIGISHSIGALVLGGAVNASHLCGMVMIAPHTGYVGDYRRAYVIPMALLWHGLMPVLTSILGYFPSRSLGLGEDLPKAVAMAWARRRTPSPKLQPNDRTYTLLDRMAGLRTRTLAITISDDGFATTLGAQRTMAFCRDMEFTHVVVSPQDVSKDALGHWGFFRTQELWPQVVHHLRQCAMPVD